MRSNEWNEGYVTEVDYTYGHYREMVPAMIQFSLLCAGVAPPEDEAFSYCELGFGQGVGLNLMAATNPKAQFFGTDFNPVQVVGASQIARQGGIDNIRLFDASFEAMNERDDLPAFDYIALHGIYSWISPANRDHLVNFIGDKLKPGGAVYISYNTQPGWAPTMPVRGLMNQYLERQTAPGQPLPQRIKESIDFVGRLASLPQGYLKAVPTVAEQVAKLSQQSGNYVAHEYFTRDWHPLFFTDVANELSRAKLSFAASADVGSLIDTLNLAAESGAIFEGVADLVLKQQIRDFVLNTRFRRDIFVKGPRPIGQSAQIARLKAFRVALVRPRSQCALEVTTLLGKSSLKAEIYAPLLDALAAGPKTIDELGGAGDSKDLPFGRLLQAVIVLISVGYAQPSVRAAADPVPAAGRLNKLLANYAREPGMPDINYLAAPALGGGFPQARFGRLFGDWIASGGEVSAGALAEHVWEVLAGLNQVIVKEGKRLISVEENRSELHRQATVWIEEQLPLLRQLGAI